METTVFPLLQPPINTARYTEIKIEPQPHPFHNKLHVKNDEIAFFRHKFAFLA